MYDSGHTDNLMLIYVDESGRTIDGVESCGGWDEKSFVWHWLFRLGRNCLEVAPHC